MLSVPAATAEEGGVYLRCGLDSRAGLSWGQRGSRLGRTLGTELSLSLGGQLA